jgi:hypothetical protein
VRYFTQAEACGYLEKPFKEGMNNLLFQCPFQHLACGAVRQFLEEFVIFGDFVMW